jgi:hypothetical protein
MVATQQVRENMIYMLEQAWILGFDTQKAVVVNYAIATGYLSKTPTPQKWDINHTIESTVGDRPNQQYRPELTQSNQTQPRFPLIM